MVDARPDVLELHLRSKRPTAHSLTFPASPSASIGPDSSVTILTLASRFARASAC